jgi:3-oxoacyl-[acyl-carrier protein] reductase
MENQFFKNAFLNGKIAVVTGAGRGIGKAIAQMLSSCGALVCAVSKSLENASETAEAIRKEGGQADAFSCDVSDPAQVEKCTKELLEKFKAIHILVNNAGITKDNLLLRMKDEEWEAVLKTNLSGAFYFSRSAAKFMLKQKEGRIVNIASVVGLIGNAGQANYAASKAGLIGFTKSLARELASRNITVNAVAPGFITTDMTHALSEKTKADLISKIPLEKLGTPQDVAYAVLFLVSPMASYITGQVLHVDGGMVM